MAGRLAALALCLLSALPAAAQDLLMTRSRQAFPEAMVTLQAAIRERGYAISRVQRIDVGLTRSGFETDRYRVVFFGRLEEVRALGASHPELIPYIPHKIAIFAEGEQTVLVATRPALLRDLFPQPDLVDAFERWGRDFDAIFAAVRDAE